MQPGVSSVRKRDQGSDRDTHGFEDPLTRTAAMDLAKVEAAAKKRQVD